MAESATPDPAKASTESGAPKAAGDVAASSLARDLFALGGSLAPEQVKLVEDNLRSLSDRQIRHLRADTDAATKSSRFAEAADNLDKAQGFFDKYWHPNTDDRLRLAAPDMVASKALTPSMYAKLQTVLLTGTLSTGKRFTFDWSKQLDLKKLLDKDSAAYTSDVDTLRQLHAGILELPVAEREPFMRACAYELNTIDGELVQRMVEELGVGEIKKAIPSIAGADAAAVAAEISDQNEVRGYLTTQRVGEAIQIYTPYADTRLKVSQASAALEEADTFAEANGVSLASQPSKLDKAQQLYGVAAEKFRAVLAHDKMAIQDPKVKAWLDRRAKSLLVFDAMKEVDTGPMPGKVTTMLRKLVRALGIKAVNAPGRAESKLLDRLEAKLGFRPGRPDLTPKEQAALVRQLEKDLLPNSEPDPLTSVMLPVQADPKSYKDVHIVFAPGVVPIDGVLDETFAALREQTGVKTHIANTGFFHSEVDNARDIRSAFDEVVAANPNAKIVVYGYSQGAANSLYFLDELRTGSEADRALAGRVAGMVSLYGAHNGSTAAEDGVGLVKSVLQRLPFGKRLGYSISGLRHVGKILAGGVDSLKRSTRKLFWERANLPTDIPYLSLGAATQEEDVPSILLKGYQDMKQAAEQRGLPPTNDTQVLVHDAPMGNKGTRMGQAVRANTTYTEVGGHHWNPLRAKHMAWDDPAKYYFPKAPQIGSQVALLAELGLLS